MRILLLGLFVSATVFFSTAHAQIGSVAQAGSIGSVTSTTLGSGLVQTATPAAQPLLGALSARGSQRRVCVYNFGVQVAGSARNARIDNRVTARNVHLVCR